MIHQKIQIVLWGVLFWLGCNGSKPEKNEQVPVANPSKSEEVGTEAKNHQEQQQKAREMLEQSAVALGGRDKFQQIHSYTSEMKIAVEKLGLQGNGKAWWKNGDFYMEVDIAGIGQTKMGIHKGKVWGEEPINGLREITGREAEQAKWAASICFVCDWQTFFTEIETVAIRQEDEQSIMDIKLVSESKDEVVLSIDMQTKLPLAQKFSQASPMGDMPVTVQFADFRELSGVKIPFSQITDTSLAQFSASLIQFDVNLEVDEQKFLMPTPNQPSSLQKPSEKSEAVKSDQ